MTIMTNYKTWKFSRILISLSHVLYFETFDTIYGNMHERKRFNYYMMANVDAKISMTVHSQLIYILYVEKTQMVKFKRSYPLDTWHSSTANITNFI